MSEAIKKEEDSGTSVPSEYITRIARLEGGYGHLSTKADVEGVKTDVEGVKKSIEGIKSEMKHFATKADLANFKSELKDDIASMRSWILSGIAFGAIAVVGAMFAIIKFLLGL